MAKKLKKQKKGLSPKVKFTLVNAGKGIISNQSVIDGSKESPWWVAAIFFVFSVIVPLIPGFAKMSQTNGGGYLSSVNYGLDTTLTSFAYDKYKSEDTDFFVENGKLLAYNREGITPKDDVFVTPDDAYITSYNEEYKYTTSEGKILLRVFLWEGLSSSKLSKYVTAITKQKYKLDGNTPYAPDDEKGTKYYTPNLVVLTPNTMAVALYKYGTTTQAATSLGGLDWTNTSGKVGLLARLLKHGIASGDIDSLNKNEYITEYRVKTMKQFVYLNNEVYLNQKTRTKWANTGIYAGIYAGVIVFLGLMVFVLTRGKNNPFKYLNIWHCQKIAWWAAFTPAILGMILAFVFSGNMIGQMAFILLISLRVMWLSMKQLRPVYPQQ